RNEASRYLGTVLVLVLPTLLVYQSFNDQPVWKAIWPLFGSTNQLMAALALVTFVVFLKAKGIRYSFALIPAIFMLIMPLTALTFLGLDGEQTWLIRSISIGMLVLGVFVTTMSLRYLARGSEPVPGSA
ncbi:MAG: carbon starvation CstA 5TM domain-containing protein, partial [Verrucomicrobiota bacterium]